MVAGRKVAAPPTLFEAYTDALDRYARPVAPEEALPVMERRAA